MKTTKVFDWAIELVSFLSAWLISLACKPGKESPISPSSSALGTNAATESITRTSIPPDFIRESAISKPCSPVSGWDIKSSSRLTPNFFAYAGSRACSASINAQFPPFFWDSATICVARVVFPELSGPYISTILPFGTPPIPKAISKPREPVDIDSISTLVLIQAS